MGSIFQQMGMIENVHDEIRLSSDAPGAIVLDSETTEGIIVQMQCSEDPELLAKIVHSMLVKYEPKVVRGLIQKGFDSRIAEMRRQYEEYRKEVEASDMTPEKQYDVLSNADGKIRSMEWFRDLFRS